MLTDEQHELRATFRRFAEREIAPHAAEADERSEYPWKSFAAYRDSGFVSLAYPEAYGGDGADYTPEADRAITYLESIGMGGTPVCMAKTQYSLTDDATKLGRPRGFRITVNEVRPSAGAGFVVAQCGDIMTMPGLPKEPAAERMARLPSGEIVGLF